MARLSRIQEGPRYLVSVAVLLTEVVKLVVCVVVVAVNAARARLAAQRGRAPQRLPTLAQMAQLAAAYVHSSVPIAFPALLVRAAPHFGKRA